MTFWDFLVCFYCQNDQGEKKDLVLAKSARQGGVMQSPLHAQTLLPAALWIIYVVLQLLKELPERQPRGLHPSIESMKVPQKRSERKAQKRAPRRTDCFTHSIQ